MLWLLIDATYLCHRAWHSVGHLAYRGVSTGVAFGFLAEMDRLQDRFGASSAVMAFDSGGPGLRSEILPTYKESRRVRYAAEDDVKKDQRKDFYEQVKRLRTKQLPAMGYRNVLRYRGYEADDIVAAAADRLPDGDEAIIVTADNDMWQCIRPAVSWYSPATQTLVTNRSFSDRWRISPVMWASVKALAGCSTDDVPGIRGIGEVFAARWFAGTLKRDSKAWQKINANLHVHNENMPLVRLPFAGCPVPKLRPDELTDVSRAAVYNELGIRSGGKRDGKTSNKSNRTGFGFGKG